MKIAEIRELSTKELVERIDAEVAAYDQKVINHSISPSEHPAQIKQQRRMIARMKTELRQRELNKDVYKRQTSGRATSSMQFSHYAQVSSSIAKQVLTEVQGRACLLYTSRCV